MATVRVQEAAFDVAEELVALSDGRDEVGGVGCFVGLVRGTVEGRPLHTLTLEHYPGMTQRALTQIAAAAERRFELLGCTIVHRIGALPPGAPIVLVLAAAAHRAAALEATAFLIDWLKTRAPFWKKERFADGEERWVEAMDTDEAAASRWD